jgi:hypothetical protein
MAKFSKKSILGGPVAMAYSASKNKSGEPEADQPEPAEPMTDEEIVALEAVDADDGEAEEGQGAFGDGITAPLYQFRASRFKGGRMFNPNTIKVWSDRIEEYKEHAVRKTGTQTINFHQVAQVKLGKGLRWSDITVESTGGHTITMIGLPKADGDKVKTLIDTAVNQTRQGHVVPVPQAAAPVDDPHEQLRKLADLHQSGLLTDEEFAAKRQVIVDKL